MSGGGAHGRLQGSTSRISGPLLGQGEAAERYPPSPPHWFGIETALHALRPGGRRAVDTFVAASGRQAPRAAAAPSGGPARPGRRLPHVAARRAGTPWRSTSWASSPPDTGAEPATRWCSVRRRTPAPRAMALLHVKTLAPSPPTTGGTRRSHAFYRGRGVPSARGAAAGLGAGEPLPAARPAALEPRPAAAPGAPASPCLRLWQRPAPPRASARCTPASRAPCRAGTAPRDARRPS